MNCNKLLIAVDGSENSIRAINYVGDMLCNTSAVSIMLLHIERFPDRDLFVDDKSWKSKCTEVRSEMEAFLIRARDMLVEKGIPEDIIDRRYVVCCKSPLPNGERLRCSRGTSIAHEILSVLQEEGYGTVVVGRRGVSKAEEFLFGSVSTKILHHAHGCTIWVVS